MKSSLKVAVAMMATTTACQTVDETGSNALAQTTLRMANGDSAGTARLMQSGADVNVAIALSGVSPGVHGVHLHMTGSCQAPDFTSAGGHLNPGGREHGFQNPQGAHLGDLPNATVGTSGAGNVSFTLRGTQEEIMQQIFDTDGTAVVVHATADDYRTNPSGDSGSRIACGILTRG